MEYKDLIQILDDLQKDLLKQTPYMSSIILLHDHETGESKYYITGFIEVQAALIKMLLDKDKVLAAHVFLSTYHPEQGS